MVPAVPLVIPEMNPEAMAHVKIGSGKGALIANPNCSTIICLMAATPLHRQAKVKVKRMAVSTYQAASGAGAAAMEELELQPCEYAFNLFLHNAPVLSNVYNEEELKLVKETRKIWNHEDVKVTATCIRVPVMRAHAKSVNLEFENHWMRIQKGKFLRRLLVSLLSMTVHPIVSQLLCRSPIKMTLLWAEYAKLFLERAIMDWTYLCAVIRYAKELPLMLFK